MEEHSAKKELLDSDEVIFGFFFWILAHCVIVKHKCRLRNIFIDVESLTKINTSASEYRNI